VIKVNIRMELIKTRKNSLSEIQIKSSEWNFVALRCKYLIPFRPQHMLRHCFRRDVHIVVAIRSTP
jgi:hypothetical protein